MILGTANIKNYPDMSKEKVVADAREMSSHCDIWGMQENDPQEDDDIISPALGDRWGKVGGGTNLPIWFRRDKFECIGFRIVFIGWAANELALVAKPRLLVVAKFSLKGRPGVPVWSLMNDHLIAGGMNGPHEQPRVTQWLFEWGKTIDVYKKEHSKTTGACTVKENGQGVVPLNSDHDGLWVDVTLDHKNDGGQRTTFLIGDLNNPDPGKPAARFNWLAGEGIDRIGVSA